MFGYVRINKMDLTFREYEHYKSYYCGLCKYLKRNYSEVSRLGLNYDITFLIIILTSIYQPKSDIYYEKCIVNPIKKKKHMSNQYTEYAAAMNVLLAYYKLQDNINDDNDLKSKIAAHVLKKSFKKAYENYPGKAEKIKSCLNNLAELENSNSKNIDLVSNTFGNLMADVFEYSKDENSDKLRRVGFNIGKYIYIMDAYEDLDKDLKSGSYNPFTEYCSNKQLVGRGKDISNILSDNRTIREKNREFLKLKVDSMVSLTLANMERAIKDLNIKVNNSIIDNIVYSGVFFRYKGILMGINNKKNQV